MAKDHFVAQTYLRQWVNPATDKMRGYGKRTGKEFPCATDNVCREWDWDVNPRFGDNPRLMGDFRKIFEPQWRPAVSAARVSQMSIDDRFAIAGYWALLTTCTPSWHRNAVQVANKQIADFIPLAARHLAKEKPEYQEFVEDALAKGKIQPNSDLLDIKAMLTQQLTQTTFLLYQQDWVIIRNDTEAAFITSDNPSSVLPRRPFSQGLVGFLPLAPDLALLTAIDPKLQRAVNIDDLDKVSPGRVQHARVTRKQVAKLNRVVVMNADELLLSVDESPSVRRLIRNHRDFVVAVESERMPLPNGGHINAATMVIRRDRKPVKS
jgi:hypothetical protein